MTIDYAALLSPEQKRDILQQRISQFAAEAYQHSLNKKSLEAVEDLAGAETSDKQIKLLTAAIEIHTAELNALPASE